MTGYDETQIGKGAHTWVQWKGTSVCLDFWCPCGFENEDFGHFDGDQAYSLQCANCGAKYDMPQTLPLLPFSGKYSPQLTRWDSDW